jgi:hypothetical protein
MPRNPKNGIKTIKNQIIQHSCALLTLQYVIPAAKAADDQPLILLWMQNFRQCIREDRKKDLAVKNTVQSISNTEILNLRLDNQNRFDKT